MWFSKRAFRKPIRLSRIHNRLDKDSKVRRAIKGSKERENGDGRSQRRTSSGVPSRNDQQHEQAQEGQRQGQVEGHDRKYKAVREHEQDEAVRDVGNKYGDHAADSRQRHQRSHRGVADNGVHRSGVPSCSRSTEGQVHRLHRRDQQAEGRAQRRRSPLLCRPLSCFY